MACSELREYADVFSREALSFLYEFTVWEIFVILLEVSVSE